MRRSQIQRVHNALKGKPYKGFGTDLAYKLGMSYQDFRIVLGTVRSREWIDEQGWTIPFVGQGGKIGQAYAVVDTKAGAISYLHPGQRARGGDLLSVLRNWEAQCDYGAVLMTGRTAEGKWQRLAAHQAKAMIAMAEALGL